MKKNTECFDIQVQFIVTGTIKVKGKNEEEALQNAIKIEETDGSLPFPEENTWEAIYDSFQIDKDYYGIFEEENYYDDEEWFLIKKELL